MLTLIEIKPGGDSSAAAEIRKTVFVEEQGIPVEDEIDGNDPLCHHIVLYEDDAPVGCGRLFINDGVARLGRVAVLKDKRGKGYATKICEALIDIARREKAKLVTLDSQAYAAPLYEKLGFTRDGEEFLEVGVPHIKMNLELR